MKKQSELMVVTKAKNLCSYVMLITQKSPKHFRYTFVSKLQNLSLEIIEKIFRANDVYVTKTDIEAQKIRLGLQRDAMTSLKLLGYIAMLAMQQQCILAKQYEEISKQIMDCQNLLGAWMNSDKKRLQS
ncbi:MAG: four helix bundle protein [Phascolarctobacterium sp.]|nr:four helix bundle protein [Phascolarctobacterium sp.]